MERSAVEKSQQRFAVRNFPLLCHSLIARFGIFRFVGKTKANTRQFALTGIISIDSVRRNIDVNTVCLNKYNRYEVLKCRPTTVKRENELAPYDINCEDCRCFERRVYKDLRADGARKN